MSLLATGVVVGRQTLNAAAWLNNLGRRLGNFPNTPAGVEQLLDELDNLRAEHRAESIHLVLDPDDGAELALIQAIRMRGWQITLVDPEQFAHFPNGLKYKRQDGIASAIQLARYGATTTTSKNHHQQKQQNDATPIQPSGILSRLRALPLGLYAAIGIILLIRLIQLDTLPGDLYGDIAIIIDYVAKIFDGRWPTDFELSAGPLYHYLIAPLLWWTGLNYYGIKLASVLTSLVTLGFTYALARELLNKEIALIAFFCAGVSCWFLIFSRLGNSQILVPLLAVSSVYFAVQGVRRRRTGLLVASALVAAGGLYTYPQSFVIPGVTGVVLLWTIWLEPRRPWRDFWVYLSVCLLGAIPFGAIVYRDLSLFLSGYIGNKLPGGTEWGVVLRENIVNTLLALHVRGDDTFRSNPTGLPQLDSVSGVLFLLGLFFWLGRTRRRLAPIILLPLVLLQIPSIMVRYTVQVPSASRTLGAVPFLSIVVAGGLWWLMQSLRPWPTFRHVVTVSLLGVMLLLNSYRYFVVYSDGLPNHNLAFGRVITTYIDSLPPERSVVVVGCCWGDQGQPHPYAIEYDLQVSRSLVLVPSEKANCEQLARTPRPTTVIWGLADGLPSPELDPCLKNLPVTLHRAPSGEAVFQSADLPP